MQQHNPIGFRFADRGDWRMSSEETWQSTVFIPGCRPKVVGVWQRIEDDDSPGWHITDPCGDGRDRQVTDAAIRAFGLASLEEGFPEGVPPLPAEAHEVLAR